MIDTGKASKKIPGKTESWIISRSDSEGSGSVEEKPNKAVAPQNEIWVTQARPGPGERKKFPKEVDDIVTEDGTRLADLITKENYGILCTSVTTTVKDESYAKEQKLCAYTAGLCFFPYWRKKRAFKRNVAAALAEDAVVMDLKEKGVNVRVDWDNEKKAITIVFILPSAGSGGG